MKNKVDFGRLMPYSYMVNGKIIATTDRDPFCRINLADIADWVRFGKMYITDQKWISLVMNDKKLDERKLNMIKVKVIEIEKNNIINRNICSVFYVPADNRIDDHTNVTLFFEVDIDGEIYKGKLFFNRLNSNNKIEQIPFELFSENGSRLSAIFTYELQLIL